VARRRYVRAVKTDEASPRELTETPAGPKGDAAKAAGRGGVAIAVAKVSFVLVGFVQQLVFPRVLDEAGYGAVSRMLAVVSIVNNVVVAMSIQGVSRTIAGAREGEEAQALRRVLSVHAVVALVVSVAFALGAGAIANALEAPHAKVPLRVAAVVVLCYGVYAPLVGALNGRRRFYDQAGLDIFYGVSRTIAMTTGAYVAARVMGLDGALGAAVGFAGAALLIVPIALSRSGVGEAVRPNPPSAPSRQRAPRSPQERGFQSAHGADRGALGAGSSSVPSVGSYAMLLLPLFVGQLGLNLLLQVDMLLLSEAAGEAAKLRGLEVKEADKLLGPYRATQLFGFLPYQLLMSVQFVLFPLLAKAHAERDEASVRAFTAQGMRLALVLTGLIGGTAAALAPQLLRFAFPEAIATEAAPFSRGYVLGMSALAVFGVASAALTSLRRELYAMGLTLATVGLIVGGIFATRPDGAFGAELLRSTAYATSGAVALGALVAALVLRGVAGALVSPLTLVRVALAVAAAFAVASVLPTLPKALVPVGALAVGSVYAGVLVATRELGRADLAVLKRVLGRK
jgi:stage V sporulation protein B